MQKLPFSLIAEQSLLGSILIDPASLNEVADLINADDFYEEAHKQIYLAMHELFLLNSLSQQDTSNKQSTSIAPTFS